MTKQKFVTIVVLNDGETFTDISGCTIQQIPLEQYEEITNFHSAPHIDRNRHSEVVVVFFVVV